MSSPTSSASSIGPIGMPKSSAALSMVSFFMPASSITSASSRYGVSARLTRKPGALFTGAGSRSMRPRKARASASTSARDLVVADDLDQLHARHRIEEMNADEPLRPRQSFAQLLERNARRVGGEDRAGLHLRLDAGKDLALEFEIFRHRFDDQIGAGNAVALEIGNQAVERVAHAPACCRGRSCRKARRRA